MKRMSDEPAKTSIKYIGLKKHMTAMKRELNGFDYEDFIRMVDVPPTDRPTKTSLAKIFHVSRHTITKWLEAYEYDRAHH